MPIELYRNGPAALTSRVSRELAAVERGALLRASQVQAIHFVGRVAIAAIADLTAMEEREATASPTAAYRLMAVGDAATSAITSVVLRMGMQT